MRGIFFGNATIRHKTNLEKVGELGNAGLNAAFAIAGKAGVGPGLEATSVNAATGLAKLSAKDLATYAMKEIPWAAGTTYLQAGLNNLAQGKNWGDMDAGQLAKDFALNVGQDVGMDVANYGRGKAMERIVNEANARANTTNNNQNSSIANVLRDNVSTDNETQGATSRLRSDIDALARVLSGRNGMQPAYAGAEADMRAQTADVPRSTN